MPIHYALFENNLTADPADYAAQIQITGSADLDQIAGRMIDQGSTVTRADILAVLEDAVTACEGLLREGYRVNLGGLCELFPRVKGVFNGLTDTFDPSRHRVDVGANPGSRVRNAVRDGATVVKEETIRPEPVPLEYVDLASGETNATVTAGTIGTVNGHRLKFNPDQADEGVFFVGGNGVPPLRAVAIQKNKPGQLVFLVPGLIIAGSPYALEVRARFGQDENPRIGRLDAVLALPPT